jgi:hypothetical protein
VTCKCTRPRWDVSITEEKEMDDMKTSTLANFVALEYEVTWRLEHKG